MGAAASVNGLDAFVTREIDRVRTNGRSEALDETVGSDAAPRRARDDDDDDDDEDDDDDDDDTDDSTHSGAGPLTAPHRAVVDSVSVPQRHDDDLFIDEVMLMKSPDELPIAFDHFATLYVLDPTRGGSFSAANILKHVRQWQAQRERKARHDFAAQVLGGSVATLVADLRAHGVDYVVSWVVAALERRFPPVTPPSSVRLFHVDAVQVMHRLFCQNLVGALPFRETAAMLQQASEACGLLDVSDESLDDHVAEPVLRTFLSSLLLAYAEGMPTLAPHHAAPMLKLDGGR